MNSKTSEPEAVGPPVLSEGLGPLPEPRMWYDHTTQRCSSMAPVGGTNERLWDAGDMRDFAAHAVAMNSAVLTRLLVQCDSILSTLEGENSDEQQELDDLRRAIAAATTPHRPEEADLLSVRARLGA